MEDAAPIADEEVDSGAEDVVASPEASEDDAEEAVVDPDLVGGAEAAERALEEMMELFMETSIMLKNSLIKLHLNLGSIYINSRKNMNCSKKRMADSKTKSVN